MYGFVAALKAQTALAFKEALRGIDVLVIDDLQFLQGKSTQVEFCHTLNALIDAGRQVVIAADRPPSDLESLDDRVRSRLPAGSWSRWDRWKKSSARDPEEPGRGRARPSPRLRRAGERARFIARTVTHNGRDLDGALNRLLAHNKLTGLPVTMEMAERAVRDLVRPQEPKRVKIEDIQRVVARQYNVSRADLPLLAPDRQRGAPAPDRDVSGEDPDAAFAARDRPAFRRPRPHDRAACGAQDREPGRQRHGTGRGDRAVEAAAAGVTLPSRARARLTESLGKVGPLARSGLAETAPARQFRRPAVACRALSCG
jgi:hypothetical protein